MKVTAGTSFQCEVTLKRGGKIIEKRYSDPMKELVSLITKNIMKEIADGN